MIKFLAIFYLVSFSSFVVACPESGIFQTVSESEWQVTVSLLENGNAEVLEEAWEPGEYEQRGQSTTYFQWSCKTNLITLKNEGIEEFLLYSKTTSLAEIGVPAENLPGLRGSCDREDCWFYQMTLWDLAGLNELQQ